MKIMCQSPLGPHDWPREAEWVLVYRNDGTYWRYSTDPDRVSPICGMCRQHLLQSVGIPFWWFEKLDEQRVAELVAKTLKNEMPVLR